LAPFHCSITRYATYLIWLGFKALFASNVTTCLVGKQLTKQLISAKLAFMQVFLCNLLNPKATLFFLAIFTQMLDAESSTIDKLIIAFIIWIEAFFWWPFVVFVFQNQTIQRRYFKIQSIFDKLLGTILTTLGVKVAFGL
jgi:threonine/homoserine/homoserine lactone efflux protein